MDGLSTDLQLAQHVVQIQLLVAKLNELHAQKKWSQLGAALSDIEKHAELAGFCANDMRWN